MTGEVEADETFIGGRARNMHKGKREAMITGAVGRWARSPSWDCWSATATAGTAKSAPSVVQNPPQDSESREVYGEHVDPGSEVFTDALPSYERSPSDVRHQVIDHAEALRQGQGPHQRPGELLESLEAALKGTYVSVEPFHLFRYLDEQSLPVQHPQGKDGVRFLGRCRHLGRRSPTSS